MLVRVKTNPRASASSCWRRVKTPRMLVRVKTVVRAKHGQADGVRRGTRPGTTTTATTTTTTITTVI